MDQLDLFGGAAPINTPTAPAAPAGDQLALFRPDFRAMRAPRARGAAARKAAAAAQLDPALHDGALI